MTDDKPGGDDEAAPATTPSRPVPQRPKMSLGEQALFLDQLCRRFRMKNYDLAGEAFLMFTQEEMLKFETIQQTLFVLDQHGADVLVRDKIARERRFRGQSRNNSPS